MKLLRHPSIVRLEAVYETRQSMYIVLEKVTGGELFSRIVGRARFSETEARALMKPLLEVPRWFLSYANVMLRLTHD
jgi:serine/threonine protein kinase